MFHTNGLIAVLAELRNRDSIILLQIILWCLQSRVYNFYVLHPAHNAFTITSCNCSLIHLSQTGKQAYFLSCSHFYDILYLLKHYYLLQAVVLTATYLDS
jgi:hypothetical protein